MHEFYRFFLLLLFVIVLYWYGDSLTDSYQLQSDHQCDEEVKKKIANGIDHKINKILFFHLNIDRFRNEAINRSSFVFFFVNF